jgi:hypothetical protein
MNKVKEEHIPFIIKHSYIKEQFDKDLIQEIAKMFI